MAVAGHQPRRAALDPDQHPVAVELDLADPARALRRCFGDGAELRRLRVRQRAAHRARRGRRFGPLFRGGLLGWAERDLRFQRERVDARPLVFVVALDEEPGILPLALAPLQPDQMEAALEPLTVQHELQIALAHAGVRIADRRPAAAVPGLDRAGAVLTFRDRALEVGVIERMVLDMRREPPVGGIERGSLAHRPAPQHAAMLKPQVPVQPGPLGRVLLHHEQRRRRARLGFARRRLGGDREIALGAVGPDRGVADRGGFRHERKTCGAGAISTPCPKRPSSSGCEQLDVIGKSRRHAVVVTTLLARGGTPWRPRSPSRPAPPSGCRAEAVSECPSPSCADPASAPSPRV